MSLAARGDFDQDLLPTRVLAEAVIVLATLLQDVRRRLAPGARVFPAGRLTPAFSSR